MASQSCMVSRIYDGRLKPRAQRRTIYDLTTYTSYNDERDAFLVNSTVAKLRPLEESRRASTQPVARTNAKERLRIVTLVGSYVPRLNSFLRWRIVPLSFLEIRPNKFGQNEGVQTKSGTCFTNPSSCWHTAILPYPLVLLRS